MVQPIERLGKPGQIVKVAPGYARNRLIPNMLALPAIDKFVIMVQEQLKVSPAWSVPCRIDIFLNFILGNPFMHRLGQSSRHSELRSLNL